VKKPECEIDSRGTKYWYSNGKCHREDGEAIEYADGAKSWYLDNKLHCEDGAAIEYANGTKCWYLNDKFYCRTTQSPLQFAKGFVAWIEAVKELQGKK